MCFNPLHCGAVVASTTRCSYVTLSLGCFNPLHCGAVVASQVVLQGLPSFLVSIPFIAGQWSLHHYASNRQDSRLFCFNPLHCGAVVASISLAESPATLQYCFNPLHCGAVVASGCTI